MAQNPSIQTNYGGEFLNRLLTLVTTGNELFERGLIHMEQNVGDKYSIPRMQLSKILQKRVEQPTSENSKGQFTIDERVLQPQDVMAYTEFNPRSFEKFWKPFQPTGELVFRELPTNVQEQMLLEIAKVAKNELGYHFINGVQGDGEEQFFNGILTRIAADKETILATTTKTKQLDRLRAVWAKVPAAMRNNPNFCFLMSVNDLDAYDDEITDSGKGKDPTSVNAPRFKGKRIEGLANWPDGVIVATIASLDIDSNLWAACNLVSDTTTIKVDRVSNAGERFFFKMLMKIDTNIVWGKLAVLLDTRTVTLTPATLTEFTDDGGEQTVKVEAPSEDWTVTPSAAWITTTKEQGQFKVTVPAQEAEGEARTGTVSVKLGGVTKNLEVKQAAYSA
ncbi:BACON domain-containing protein [Alistipes putredinis]|jgi:hypothetical protein|uniref:BACON domain-containing protein n=1 Tax=Alistipes putredinis TaxID=28117 RepID=UPI003AB78A23